jgi:hypothetical protein
MAQPSFRIDDDLEQFVESRIIEGQAKSVWYRYSIETTIQVDPILDEIFEPYQYEKRKELVEAAVKKEVDRRKDEINNGN